MRFKGTEQACGNSGTKLIDFLWPLLGPSFTVPMVKPGLVRSRLLTTAAPLFHVPISFWVLTVLATGPFCIPLRRGLLHLGLQFTLA
jgi:hypothetical protein